MKSIISKFVLTIIIIFIIGVYIQSSTENIYLIKSEEQIETILEDEVDESQKKEIYEDEIDKNQNEEVYENQEEIVKENELEEDNNIDYINIDLEKVRIPILMYHSISNDDPNNTLMIPINMFKEQIEWLNTNGFTAMTMDELLEAMETGRVPKRPVVITFDDGYADNYTNAFPILKDNNMKGTFFIITNVVDKNSYYMSSDMLKEMQEYGMVIENHTSNHVELNKLSREGALQEIKDAQSFLREVIGSKGEYLCYPVGRYNDITIELAKELGIKAAVTTKGGISCNSDGKHELKRVRISPMNIENFAEIFSEYIY